MYGGMRLLDHPLLTIIVKLQFLSQETSRNGASKKSSPSEWDRGFSHFYALTRPNSSRPYALAIHSTNFVW